MAYIIITISLFSLVILIRYYSSKYTWFFVAMSISLNLLIFETVLFIAKTGDYPYPANPIFQIDYRIFLYISTLKADMNSIVRFYNIALLCYLISSTIFVLLFSNIEHKLRGCSFWVKIGVVTVFPLWLLVYHDPIVSLYFYIILTQSHSKLWDVALSIIRCINNVLVIAYLVAPLAIIFNFYRKTTIRLKRMQTLSLGLCLSMLNLFCGVLHFFGPSKYMYIFTFAIIDSLTSTKTPRIFYNVIPFIMLIVLEVMLLVVIKLQGFATVDIFKEMYLHKNIKGLNNNMLSIFHSFKNTLFTLKLYSKKSNEMYGTPQGCNASQELYNLIDSSLTSVTRMMDSFRDINLEIDVYSVNEIIDHILVEYKVGPNIEIRKNYHCIVSSRIDYYHFTEAFLNILRNSIEAIEVAGRERGTITIDVSSEHEWAIIKVTDNGVGIKKSDLYKVFKPFQTTKSRKTNWGVGLSYVYRVIKAHLGFITMESVYGKYTTVQILIPKAEVI